MATRARERRGEPGVAIAPRRENRWPDKLTFCEIEKLFVANLLSLKTNMVEMALSVAA